MLPNLLQHTHLSPQQTVICPQTSVARSLRNPVLECLPQIWQDFYPFLGILT